MSPNMQVKRVWTRLRSLFKRQPRKLHKHSIGSHAESQYVWTLLGVDSATSQEMRNNRNDRRTNGFSSVAMTIGKAEVK